MNATPRSRTPSLSAVDLVIAYVQPFRLAAVMEALQNLPNFPGATIAEARGTGPCDRSTSVAEGGRPAFALEVRSRIEIACRPEDTAEIVDTVRDVAHTGEPGDGKVMVLPVMLAVSIRSGAFGADAIARPTPARGL